MAAVDAIDQIKIGLKMVDFKVQQRLYRTNEKIIVDTTYGPIKGVKRKSVYGQEYYSFEGIPFAKPPIGDLRYKAPEPPEIWVDVKSCTSQGPKPLQKHYVFQMTEGSEDCLYLNVYTKDLQPIEPMAVMVWIYGGGFQFGEASRDCYSPDYLLQENVIIVSINYRLGPLGFLSLPDPAFEVPGNAGLKDQVLALRWVKENCATFGGNPNNITIFGNSAGAASVHYMMITEQTRDLFHKAIVMSGCALAPWAVVPQRNWPYRLALKAGYNGPDDNYAIWEFLSNAKGTDIIKANSEIDLEVEKKERIGFCFGPVIEPYITSHTIVPSKPIEMMRNAWSNQIPMIIGGVSNEGLLMYTDTKTNPKCLNELSDCRFVTPIELNLDRSSAECLAYGKRLLSAYYDNRVPSLNTLDEYLKMVSHEYFWFPIYRTILSRLKYAQNMPTYVYRFDFDSKYFNHLRILTCGKKVRGTCHGDDLSYLFYNSLARKLKKDSSEYQCIQRLVGLCTHFAIHGNAAGAVEVADAVHWQPARENDIKNGQLQCLNITDKLEIINLPDIDQIKVWESFFQKDQLI